MVYGSIENVRTLASIKPVYQHGQRLKDGDGSSTEFKIPSVGLNQGFFVDLAGVTSSEITVDDIVVYDDGTPVTVSSIDEDAGTVTLSVAPADDSVMTADYKRSQVSDGKVIEAMEIAEELVDDIIRGSNVAGNSYVQYESGDGEEFEWEFDHSDVISFTSVVVDGSTLTEDTDYWVRKFPRTDRYWYIEFDTRPNKGHKNIVITYIHGNNQKNIDKLSNLYAARHLIHGDVRLQDSSGMWIEGAGNYDSEGDRSKLGMINREIIDLQSILDRRSKFETA